jgi:hypothetical protein
LSLGIIHPMIVLHEMNERRRFWNHTTSLHWQTLIYQGWDTSPNQRKKQWRATCQLGYQLMQIYILIQKG